MSAPAARLQPSTILIAIPAAALLSLILGAVCVALLFGEAQGCGSTSVVGKVKGVPTKLVPIYQQAAAEYRLGSKGAAILAAINWEETAFGTNLGVSSAEAEGWMQFLPSSWEEFGVDANGDGVKDPYNPWDAIFAAARLLSHLGAPGNWHDAIYGYNHAEWYVEDVLADAEKFAAGATAEIAGSACGAAGDALLARSQKLYAPLSFKSLPAKLWVGGGLPQAVDARIWPDAVWLLERYGLLVTAAREPGHETHGDGTALDMVPISGRDWDQTALRAALALGWTPGCGWNGSAPVCPLVPAIQFVGYNGYKNHGDPEHSAIPHLHVSWKSSEYGCSGLCAPREWVMAFPLSP